MFSLQQWLVPLILLFPPEIFFKLVLVLVQIKLVEKETGLSTSEIISNKLNEDIIKKNQKNNIDESLLILVDLNIKKT